MDEIELRAHGKINLSLDVLGRRNDGYHEVKMIMHTVALHDGIFIKKERERGIRMECNLPSLPTNEENLMVRAAKAIIDEFSIEEGLSLRLMKRLPVAAGMAGGSADAAAVFHGINQLFHLNLSTEELEKRAVKLGADIPFCLHKGCYLSEGIGEKLCKLPSLPPCTILLVKPAFSLSTKLIYENLHLENITDAEHPDVDRMIKELESGSLEDICALGDNLLEKVSISLRPEIQVLKDFFIKEGALLSLMSGSGPTVFGIFPEKEKANAEKILQGLRSGEYKDLIENAWITEAYA
jgi:4-(cytidine 5'-diphospho)-2-C-methyl-D-erythritol kinase